MVPELLPVSASAASGNGAAERSHLQQVIRLKEGVVCQKCHCGGLGAGR